MGYILNNPRVIKGGRPYAAKQRHGWPLSAPHAAKQRHKVLQRLAVSAMGKADSK